MNKLNPMLSSFKDRSVKNIDIQVHHETISVLFTENQSIEFTGVKSFLFVEDEFTNGNAEFLSSIEFYKDGFAEFITYDEDFEEIYGTPNFSLDFIDQSLLIEANAIHIDGKKIKLSKIEN